MKKRLLGVLLTISVIAGALAGCGGNKNQASSTAATGEGGLKVLRNAVMTGQLDQYATEVGLWQGIFKKHGIDLKTNEFVAGINTIDAIVNGQADVGMMADYAAVNRIGNTQDNTDLRIFSELSGGGIRSGGLYVPEKYAKDLKSLDGSEGFVTHTGTVSDYYAARIIEYIGLDYNKQKLLNADSTQTQLALVKNNQASAIFAVGSQAKYVEEYGWKLAATVDELKITTGAYYLAKEGYIKENKQLLADYLTAIAESVKYIDEHFDESAKYLADKLGVKEEDFKLQWKGYELRSGFSEDAAKHLEEIEKWAFGAGRFKKDYNIRDFINTEAIEIAFPDKVTLQK